MYQGWIKRDTSQNDSWIAPHEPDPEVHKCPVEEVELLKHWLPLQLSKISVENSPLAAEL